MQDAIDDYAIIGDGRSTALVSKRGAIDWLCWPEPDSQPLFGAILGAEAGTFRIAPTAESRMRRQYADDTNVLVTRFETADGAVELTDAMLLRPERDRRGFTPEHELLRHVEARSGTVELEVRFAPRRDFGRRAPRLRDRGALGWRVEDGRHLFTLSSDVSLSADGDATLIGRCVLREGQSASFSLTSETDQPSVLPPLSVSVRELLPSTRDWWRRWAGRCTHEGIYRDAVVRSLLMAKLLTFAPSGAVIAAATTSLPERLGGDLNWDYRYCWLRDAAITVRALLEAGYPEEARGFASWLLHSTRLAQPELNVLYDVYGRRPRRERVIAHLPGFEGSRPVRIGNAAAQQLQLDCYGEVIDAVARVAMHDGELDRVSQRMLSGFGRYVCESWREPDSGIWEPRGPRQHYTHSRLMSWVALDRLLELSRRGLLHGAPVDRLREHCTQIRREIEERGWNADLGAYTATLDGREIDAAVLLMGWHGFHDPSHPRLRSTFSRIVERLGVGNALLYRYERSRDAGEGAFGICSFWAAEHLARGGGPLAEAKRCFEGVQSYANDVGLFAEEIDPRSGAALGNFPQAFTHVGLIGAALAIRDRARDSAEAAA